MQSTVVFGRCRLLETGEETRALLKRFAMKYYPDEKLADEEIAQAEERHRSLRSRSNISAGKKFRNDKTYGGRV